MFLATSLACDCTVPKRCVVKAVCLVTLLIANRVVVQVAGAVTCYANIIRAYPTVLVAASLACDGAIPKRCVVKAMCLITLLIADRVVVEIAGAVTGDTCILWTD